MRDYETSLTWEQMDYLFDIDPIAGSVIWKNPSGNRAANLKGKPAGCFCHPFGYVPIYINKKMYKRHRLIWFYVHKKWPCVDIDHIDGSKQNDSINNLREADKSQNMFNSKIRITNKSGIKGICWDRRRKRWKATIRAYNKEIHIGRYLTLEEATFARISAEEKYHGEFRRAA